MSLRAIRFLVTVLVACKSGQKNAITPTLQTSSPTSAATSVPALTMPLKVSELPGMLQHTPDGHFIAASSTTLYEVRTHTAVSLKQTELPAGSKLIYLSPSGTRALVQNSARYELWSTSPARRVTELGTLPDLAPERRAVILSEQGNVVSVMKCEAHEPVSEDRKRRTAPCVITLLNAEDGATLAKVPLVAEGSFQREFLIDNADVTLSNDGQYLNVEDRLGNRRFYRTSDGTALKPPSVFYNEQRGLLPEHDLLELEKERLVFALAERVAVHDLRSGKELRHASYPVNSDGQLTHVHLSERNRVVSVDRSKRILYVLDYETAAPVRRVLFPAPKCEPSSDCAVVRGLDDIVYIGPNVAVSVDTGKATLLSEADSRTVYQSSAGSAGLMLRGERECFLHATVSKTKIALPSYFCSESTRHAFGGTHSLASTSDSLRLVTHATGQEDIILTSAPVR
jgi:hypothetical protein